MPEPRPAPHVFRETLEALGITHAFGLPGTQNMELFEALRGSRIRVVVPTHELAAAFMANGHHRVSGRAALVLSIGGPGFAYTLPAVAEASLDSAAMLQITSPPPRIEGRSHLSQAIDQDAIAAPLHRGVFELREAEDLAATLAEALRVAQRSEPGPVLVQLDPSCMDAQTGTRPTVAPAQPAADGETLDRLADELRKIERPLLFVGQGCLPAAREVTELAERLQAAVLSTSSGRGIVPEDHGLSLGFEFAGTRAEAMNELVESSGLVLALGCRFSQNGTRGFRLRIPQEKLVHVDRSQDNLGVNYPARTAIHAEAGGFTRSLLERLGTAGSGSRGWSATELEHWRERGRHESWLEVPEPEILGEHPARFFEALRKVLPRDTHLVTDSGLHQFLARRWFRVLSPAGLVMPTGFQSMGFGLPAAIGAQLAHPQRRVVALIGDGGLLMTGMELITAARLELDLCVMVINDASYGLIRRSQEAAYGTAPSSELTNPDYETLAASLGVHYLRLGPDPEPGLREALSLRGVSLVEIPAGPSPGLRFARAKGRLKRALGPRTLARLRRRLGS